MFVGYQLSLRRDDPARQPVAVLLWQYRHESWGITWLVAPEAGARRVFVRHVDHRRPYRPCRVPGERWTRTVVTIERSLAERLQLKPLSAGELAEILPPEPPRPPLAA